MHTLLLTLKDGKTREYPLRSLPAVVGRAEGAQIRIPHQSLDPEHARLVERDGDLYVEDLGSESGVLVNRKKVSESVLISGDELRLGVAVFKVHVEEELVLPGQAKPEARPKPKARAVRPQDIRVKSEILQFNKIDARKGRSFLGDDFAQYGGTLRLVAIFLLVALAAASFFFFKWVGSSVTPEEAGSDRGVQAVEEEAYPDEE